MSAILTIDGLRLLHRYDTARKALAMWAEEKEKVRAELIAALGENTEGFFDGKRVVGITRSRPLRFSSKDFASDHPDLYARYVVAPDEDEVRLNVTEKLPMIPGAYSRFYDESVAS